MDLSTLGGGGGVPIDFYALIRGMNLPTITIDNAVYLRSGLIDDEVELYPDARRDGYVKSLLVADITSWTTNSDGICFDGVNICMRGSGTIKLFNPNTLDYVTSKALEGKTSEKGLIFAEGFMCIFAMNRIYKYNNSDYSSAGSFQIASSDAATYNEDLQLFVVHAIDKFIYYYDITGAFIKKSTNQISETINSIAYQAGKRYWYAKGNRLTTLDIDLEGGEGHIISFPIDFPGNNQIAFTDNSTMYHRYISQSKVWLVKLNAFDVVGSASPLTTGNTVGGTAVDKNETYYIRIK